MQGRPLAVAFTAINIVVLLLTLAHSPHTTAEPPPAVLRARALELVDDRGQIRSRLTVEPTGEVVLRLLDQNGTIRVKLGASQDGSGLVLLDEATEPAIQALARRTSTPDKPITTSLTLRGAAGPPRVINP
jgi:hypothetical protein